MSTIVQMLAGNPKIDPVAELQKKFALIKLGGKVGIVELPLPGVSWAAKGTLQMYESTSASRLLTRALQLVPSAVAPKDVIRDFYASISTVMFDEITFDPRPTEPSVINLWTGPTVTGVPGTFPTIQQFIDEVVANGDPVVATYLLDFLAHMLQHPEEKPKVMLVLMGGQGTGKGTFSRILQSIWSRTTLITNQIDNVTGKFNSVLERKFVVWLDEALFAKNFEATEALKSFVSEPTISIHAKHKEPRNTFSCHRFFAATNASHFARTEVDDRRFVYLPVSSRHRGNGAYWNTLNRALASPELPALVYHLQNRNLASFDPTVRPNEDALVDQKVKSLVGVDKWWYSVLQTGELRTSNSHSSGGSLELSQAAPIFFGTALLISSYETFAKAHALHNRSVTEKILKDQLKILCPTAIYTRKLQAGNQNRGYDIPPLPVARSEFEKFIGGALEWSL